MRGALFSILLAVSTYAAADSSTLKGVWQIASSSYDDQAITLIEPRQIKLFTSDRVFYTYYPAQEDESAAAYVLTASKIENKGPRIVFSSVIVLVQSERVGASRQC